MAGSHLPNGSEEEQQGIMLVTTTTATAGDHWEVQYARFFNCPSLSSSAGVGGQHPSLIPLVKRRKGLWISSFTSLSYLKLITTTTDESDNSRSIILTVDLVDKVVIQKFAVRFHTIDEALRFINSLKEIFGQERIDGSMYGISKSKTSSQSQIFSSPQPLNRSTEDWDPISSSADNSQPMYRPTQDWSPIASPADAYIQPIQPSEDHDASQNSNPLKATLDQDVQEKLSAFPPSFSTLLMNCFPAAEQDMLSKRWNICLLNQPSLMVTSNTWQTVVNTIIPLPEALQLFVLTKNIKPQSMASQNRVFLLLVFFIHGILALPTSQTTEIPFSCFKLSNPCNSILYQHNGLTETNISSLYSVDISQIQTIGNGDNQDRLITVPCSCQNVNNTVAYFYDVIYSVKPGDTFLNVSDQLYSGQAWEIGDEGGDFKANKSVELHLLCGCTETDSQIMVTYTVQQSDTLIDIANRLSAEVGEIQSVNNVLLGEPRFILPGWVLFVPMYKNGIPPPASKKKNHKWVIIFGVLVAVITLLLCMSIIMFMKRKRSQEHDKENAKVVSKTMSFHRSASGKTRYKENMEGITGFDTERPLVYDLDEIAEATNNFDDTRKIGEGGYGSVYFGILGGKEVAIKKMRSNKSKEFLAELKVLCKIHHINVVELLGFASGDDHLYLVYEFISNGSLSEHLHDPLLKGHQPLSWTARARIALDTAKGIEYIHDHTKEQYVHRDIKTSNILLDNGLRAKVADFGLAKLVGRTNDDDFIATRLVGTPGYLPPESVKELHVTTKTDVFAFGVVLAELITGKRALMRDNQEPNKMKSLITVITRVFEDSDPEGALVSIRDGSLRDSYPIDDLYKMAEVSYWCLSEDPVNRPEVGEIVESLARIVMSSVEWEASLGGSSQVFSGVFDGR
ncbi:hypothetical protein L6452_16968 [Arctium lappa]|uniref:Uncharacterized protein n=1 Tax=Arctium lappa TaxID=4217 RepID=A0ACB9C2A2_ARCLA|nr:hypothetical protein L6452_16968 [Arctium lappa]